MYVYMHANRMYMILLWFSLLTSIDFGTCIRKEKPRVRFVNIETTQFTNFFDIVLSMTSNYFVLEIDFWHIKLTDYRHFLFSFNISRIFLYIRRYKSKGAVLFFDNILSILSTSVISLVFSFPWVSS